MSSNFSQKIDYDDNDLKANVIGTVPNSEIEKSKLANNTSQLITRKDVEQLNKNNGHRHKMLIISLIFIILALISALFFINSGSTKTQTKFKSILHKQSFVDSAPKHVIQVAYPNRNRKKVYIALFGNKKWALSNRNCFNDLKYISNNDAIQKTGKALKEIDPKHTDAFSNLTGLKDTNTNMKYYFSGSGTILNLLIIIKTKSKTINSEYVLTDFKNTAMNKFTAKLSKSNRINPENVELKIIS